MIGSELPAVVPVERFLATSPRFTIDLSAIYVYSDHCVFDMAWVLRRTPEERKAWQEHVVDDDSYMWEGMSPDDPAPDPEFSRLHCTTELADGRTVSDFADGIVSSRSMSHGSANPTILPLPPPGELRITLDWPEFGIHNAVTLLDATAINEAARRVRQL